MKKKRVIILILTNVLFNSSSLAVEYAKAELITKKIREHLSNLSTGYDAIAMELDKKIEMAEFHEAHKYFKCHTYKDDIETLNILNQKEPDAHSKIKIMPDQKQKRFVLKSAKWFFADTDDGLERATFMALQARQLYNRAFIKCKIIREPAPGHASTLKYGRTLLLMFSQHKQELNQNIQQAEELLSQITKNLEYPAFILESLLIRLDVINSKRMAVDSDFVTRNLHCATDIARSQKNFFRISPEAPE